MIPLNFLTITGMLAIISLICTLVFGMLIKTTVKLHRIFAAATILLALTHAFFALKMLL